MLEFIHPDPLRSEWRPICWSVCISFAVGAAEWSAGSEDERTEMVMESVDRWLLWASAICCHPVAIAFQLKVQSHISNSPHSCIEWRKSEPSTSQAANFFHLAVIDDFCEVDLRFRVQDIGTPDDERHNLHTLSPAFIELGSGCIPSCIFHSLQWWV